MLQQLRKFWEIIKGLGPVPAMLGALTAFLFYYQLNVYTPQKEDPNVQRRQAFDSLKKRYADTAELLKYQKEIADMRTSPKAISPRQFHRPRRDSVSGFKTAPVHKNLTANGYIAVKVTMPDVRYSKDTADKYVAAARTAFRKADYNWYVLLAMYMGIGMLLVAPYFMVRLGGLRRMTVDYLKDEQDLIDAFEKVRSRFDVLNTPRKLKRFSNKVRIQLAILRKFKARRDTETDLFPDEGLAPFSFTVDLFVEMMIIIEHHKKDLLLNNTYQDFMQKFRTYISTEGQDLTWYKHLSDNSLDEFTRKVYEYNHDILV